MKEKSLIEVIGSSWKRDELNDIQISCMLYNTNKRFHRKDNKTGVVIVNRKKEPIGYSVVEEEYQNLQTQINDYITTYGLDDDIKHFQDIIEPPVREDYP